MKVLVFLTILSLALSGSTFRSVQFSPVSGATNVIRGLLKGIGSEITTDDIKPCLADIDDMIPDLQEAISYYNQHTSESYRSCLLLLGLALKDVPSAIDTCKGGATQAASIISDALKTFTDPSSFPGDLTKALVLDGKDIKVNFAQAAIKWSKSDYEGFGFSIGQAMYNVFQTLEEYNLMSLHISASSPVDIVKGFFEAFKEEIVTADVKPCLKEVDDMIPDLKEAIESCKQDTAEGVRNCLIYLTLAAKAFPTALSTCQTGASQALNIVTDLAKTMLKPSTFSSDFVKAYVLDSKDIKSSLAQAASMWSKNDMEGFGYSLGQTLYEMYNVLEEFNVLLGSSQDASLELLDGFLFGIASDMYNDEIKSCFADIETVEKDIKAFFTEIKTETLEGMVEGFKTLGNTLDHINSAIAECKSKATDVIAIVSKASKQFISPYTFAYHVGRAILVNEKQIYNEITTAMRAWNNAEYFNCGYNIGKAVVIVAQDKAIEPAYNGASRRIKH
ncbi:unnamed protein product [Blepharisma stoltei]|uniref:Uncharacterized protein n=1 Tax=Blepharisma stoltei TaxID=1481888 RepID=A0AAU9IQ50_9CILI|nr:unnamed protein product [Blepharisma stoltei]